MIEHAWIRLLGPNCPGPCSPKQCLTASIEELIQNDTEKASHGGIAKARDIDYQPKGRPIGLALMITGFSWLSLRCKKLLHVVIGSSSQESNTSCHGWDPRSTLFYCRFDLVIKCFSGFRFSPMIAVFYNFCMYGTITIYGDYDKWKAELHDSAFNKISYR